MNQCIYKKLNLIANFSTCLVERISQFFKKFKEQIWRNEKVIQIQSLFSLKIIFFKCVQTSDWKSKNRMGNEKHKIVFLTKHNVNFFPLPIMNHWFFSTGDKLRCH